MVSSSDVNGTEVYNPAGEHLGRIDHLVIDKVSGQIAYAVMTFGGFLGLGEGMYPLPWKKFRFDKAIGGFVTDVSREQLTGAPSLTETWFDDRDYHRRNYDYYGVLPYWM
ncbi:PRC-barrel domain-containing protein [Tabrizicola sp.]|jgi:hypothetical protein|uniref:PRC-barrel domain-containing protein n=1 Tax=Tabrizicola sp. TaxID=2005166 RepID=UPI001A520CE1|nr:PRC-barrel domain-containing protein [Tabrizicola sp.]MBL9063523.1 PRC-barrel domain-containing protein [Tabrizicola sp.]